MNGRVVCAWIVLLGVLGLGLTACTSHYQFGRQTRAHFVAQRVSQNGVTGAPAGLDSEEASLIHAGYRHSLVPEGVNVEREGNDAQVLIISDDQGQARTARPVPRR